MKNLNRQLGIQVTDIPTYMGGGFLNATGEETALKSKIASAKSKLRSLEKKKADEEIKLKDAQKRKARGLAALQPGGIVSNLYVKQKFNPKEATTMVKQANVAIEQAKVEIRNIETQIALLNNEIAQYEAELSDIIASTPSPAPTPSPSPRPTPTPIPTPVVAPTSSMTESTPLTTGDLTSGGSGKNNTLLYVGIGVVVLGGIAYFVMKK